MAIPFIIDYPICCNRSSPKKIVCENGFKTLLEWMKEAIYRFQFSMKRHEVGTHSQPFTPLSTESPPSNMAPKEVWNVPRYETSLTFPVASKEDFPTFVTPSLESSSSFQVDAVTTTTSTTMTQIAQPVTTTDMLFRCKTSDAYIFKILIELLHNNIKTACFEVTAEKISLRMMDSNRRTLVDIVLLAQNFNMYFFSSTIDPPFLNIGINLNHFYKMIKSIKKKDSLVLFIQENKSHDLGIQVIPRDQNRIMTSFVRIQNIQNLEIAVPSGYNRSILVSCAEFSKMCKDMFNMSNTITISAQTYSVGFVCNVGSVYSREVILGETDSESMSSIQGGSEGVIQDDYDTEQLSRINKISGLSTGMTIHCGLNLPLLLQTKIGSLGYISIYVKSRRQIEEETMHDL